MQPISISCQHFWYFYNRPKDLTQIKRHIENGTIRTTTEFQRDMMLMFTNAIMYNNSNHDVYRMATEMYNDVMEQIEVGAMTSWLKVLLVIFILEKEIDYLSLHKILRFEIYTTKVNKMNLCIFM